MAIPIRFAPVLEGDEAIEFYERWQESLEKPIKYPSKEEIEGFKEIYRKYVLNKLNNGL